MRSVIGSFAGILLMLPVMALAPLTARAQQAPADPFADPYKEVCAVCHGANMEGAAPPALPEGAIQSEKQAFRV